MSNKKKDIIWIVLDQFRPDYLNLENKKNSKGNYIEKKLCQGKLYTNTIAATKFSLGAAYTTGTGLLASVTGMNTYGYDFSKAKTNVIYSGDYLKKLGYKTFYHSDVNYRHFPSSGIDVYELSRLPRIWDSIGLSYDTPGRRQFIKSFKNTTSPKFLVLHLFALHDVMSMFYGVKGYCSSEGYKKSIKVSEKDFQIVMGQLGLTGEELLVMSSDHGCVLNKNYIKEEIQEGTSMRPENLRTFCSFISSGITPCIINERYSALDILPTIFELAGLPAIPVQGNSLISNEGSTFQITEGIGIYEFPFDRASTDTFSIYKDEWKLVLKRNFGKKLYRVKNNVEREVKIADHSDIVKHLSSEINRNLKMSFQNVTNERLRDLKSQGKKVLSLSREDLPVRIILFLVDYTIDCLYRFMDDMKSQMELYFELHIFDEEDKLPKYFRDINPRIKIHQEKLQTNILDRILSRHPKKPEFVGFVNSSIEYYDDYLYELRRLLETNSQSDLAYSKLEKGLEHVFLARTRLIKQFILQGMEIEDISKSPEHVENSSKVEYKYQIGSFPKKKVAIAPLDDSTIKLLRVEGIKYIKPENVGEKEKVDIIACSSIEYIQIAQELANLHSAVAVYIDYEIDSPIPKVNPNGLLKVIKRQIDDNLWLIMNSNTKVVFKGNYLWQLFEDLINRKHLSEKSLDMSYRFFLFIRMIKKLTIRLIFLIIRLIKKMTLLPLLNFYPIRKLLYPIRIRNFKPFRISTRLYRTLPYSNHFPDNNKSKM